MGKVAIAEMKRKKKKGRPPKAQIPLIAPRNPIILDSPPITYSRSHRRNPKFYNISLRDRDADDDDDERKEKKVKLVVRLPKSDDKETPKINQKDSAHSASEPEPDPASESEPDSGSPAFEDRDAKKRKVNDVDHGSEGAVSAQEKKDVKATDTQQHGSPLESGPTQPLPDKKLLVFILDRLQKKDTYGVFSEPVDVNELPDYFEYIDQPMDFGTVRKKLNRGAYKKLEELEADVFLICSNAMLYNAPDTVYYRQARSIQEIAKRDFENLRHEGDNGQPQPKVVRRGRPPGNKNQKKSLETSPLDRVGADPPSGAALTNVEDKATGSNSYNLRKGPALYRYRPNDPYVSSYRPRNGEHYPEFSGDWNNEFPASILRADMKYGKKQFTIDENRRDTYREFHPLSPTNNPSAFSNSGGDMKQLMMVGPQESFAYARSLARFAANLGPVAWKVASKKIEYVLPPGTEYGPGWVAENGATASQPPPFPNTPDFRAPDLSPSVPHGLSEEMVEAVRRLNSQNERGLQSNTSPWKTPFPPVQQNHMYHQPQIQRNGFGGMPGYDAQTSRLSVPAMEGFQFPSQAINPMLQEMPAEGEMWTFGRSSWPAVPAQHGRSLAAPPDLNMRVLAGSPSSSLPIGSPQQQPDLALQL
ncbi:cat eye syndrome critical region protein 2 homolog [Salvia splendens]|uniref:cat eye syndrome critical region protein 2 homolog n=1 Tax=Salvia splendens TaxID=180675 RepID=UPI001C262906|nr:cat eye syndrome critical region protein 2 homolog [Salvia splendens]